MLRFADNPPMLPPEFETIASIAGDWWVGHTKARFEKAFAFDLAAKRIPYYLPMVERIKMSGNRKRRVLIPLFPSYVFFCGDADAKYGALTTDRLCSAIPVVNREQFILELISLERALASNTHLDLYPFAAVGRRCRVRTGPLEGIVGTVIERDHKPRLILQVSMLGAGATLEIEVDLLEPID
jgi:transcription termination factor NusG